MTTNQFDTNTSDLGLAIANATMVNSNPDRAYVYATTLGALQGLCEFHLTEKQKANFVAAFNRLSIALLNEQKVAA
jgi:hypothetical protein